MIVSLEARYGGFEEDSASLKRNWNIACEGLFGQRLRAGYLMPLYGIKVLQDHPILLNYSSETCFSITGGCENIALLMGELFLVHNQKCGNWVQFHRIFGFLPTLLETNTDFTLVGPTALVEHYRPVLQRHKINYKTKALEPRLEMPSVLLFSSDYFPDRYDHGQSYIVATSFELLEDQSS
ncbi:MAG: hypothetical protein WKF66_16410 [Pedobacter sp.]